jgi:hypothetical protein
MDRLCLVVSIAIMSLIKYLIFPNSEFQLNDNKMTF